MCEQAVVLLMGSISNQLPTPLLPWNVPSTVNIPQAQILAEVFP